jgi:hypothetical protein
VLRDKKVVRCLCALPFSPSSEDLKLHHQEKKRFCANFHQTETLFTYSGCDTIISFSAVPQEGNLIYTMNCVVRLFVTEFNCRMLQPVNSITMILKI